MKKTLTVFLVAGLAITTTSHAETSASAHLHDHDHDHATTDAAQHQHDGHHNHGESQDEDHDAHESDADQRHAPHDDHDHKAREHSAHEDTTSASLQPEQMSLADIHVEALTPRQINYQLYAPGEILSNGYTSYRVSPRAASVVVRRHVALGDHVKQGQPLITLFSETVAQAQAAYRTAWPEWQRVQTLGRKTVGEQRYISARTSLEVARATLLAYGLSAQNLPSLASEQSVALGEYTLHAKIEGVVLADDFEQGQRIDAGEPLIVLADEKQLWVEAHLPANLSLTLGADTRAEVVAGEVRAQGLLTQEAHTIDPITRTRTVRLSVDNPEHRLHAGQFAEVHFHFSTQKPVLAVPETALMRDLGGNWTVFVENHPGEFEPMIVNLGRALGVLREITGIAAGTRIVTKGAFFVASQIAKGGFDPHNH